MTDADSDDARTLRLLQAAACTYRIAFGRRAGQKVLTLQGAMPRKAGFKQDLCANMQGFSPHAAVRCAAGERKSLEQLSRYVTRPALANERVQCNAAGQVVLKLKTLWHDGTTHLVMSPLEFMQRLAALAIEERPSVARAAAAPAPDPLPRGAGSQRQDARAGGATRAGRAGRRSNPPRARRTVHITGRCE